LVYRAAIGEYVSKRLLRTPGVMRMPAKEADMFVMPNFLPPEDCAGLIEMIERDRHPSGVLSDDPIPGYRTSETSNLGRDDPLVASVDHRIWKLTGIQPNHGETIQGQRYAPGQQFKPHHDFFYSNARYWEIEEKQGGQRTWTVMIFLNEPEEGGHTFFPEVNVRIAPRAGNLLAWNNLDANGNPNLFTLHEGTPVKAGVKYILTKWFRERPWLKTAEDEEIVVQAPRAAPQE
jgi:prolyl 4-hydroxylase